jgi:hypothetical protein
MKRGHFGDLDLHRRIILDIISVREVWLNTGTGFKCIGYSTKFWTNARPS